MRYSRLFVVGSVVAFVSGCVGCGHDEVLIKDQRPESTPATTVTIVQPAAPAPAPGTTVNVNK